MLSEEEKKEMLEDGLDQVRKKDFAFSKNLEQSMTFDEYIGFLDGLQKVFGPFEISKKITETKLNLL